MAVRDGVPDIEQWQEQKTTGKNGSNNSFDSSEQKRIK